jgi:hypothetical protein
MCSSQRNAVRTLRCVVYHDGKNKKQNKQQNKIAAKVSSPAA